MNIPATTHARVKYRNGEYGILITTEKKETNFSVLTIRDKHSSLMHHREGGQNWLANEESEWDIVEILESECDDFSKEREVN